MATTTTFYRVLRTRLPFLPLAEETEYITDLKLDVFYTLQSCFKLSDADVEDETKYTRLQLMLAADIVAIKWLLGFSASRIGGTTDSGGGSNVQTYLKRAKAGSAEAEFAQVTGTAANVGGLAIGDLLTQLRNSALAQAGAFGCIIDALADVTVELEPSLPMFYMSGQALPSPGCSGDCEACGN